MISKTTILAILQQSEYDYKQFVRWYKQRQKELADGIHTAEVQPKEWTLKLKLISGILSGLFFLPLFMRVRAALLLVKPLEFCIRRGFYWAAATKLWYLKKRGLQVIAIAGSYAKTSTKTIMAHTLSGSTSVYMTPKSINTLLGIAQVILKELKPEHQVFIVEMGEYRRGDLKKMLQFTAPNLGVLTPIGRQHLDIIGGFENILLEMRDFIFYFQNEFNKLLIIDQNQEYFADIAELQWYGTKAFSILQARQAHVTRAGTEFSLYTRDTNSEVFLFMPLFGEHQALNTLPAFWAGSQLGISPKELSKRISTLPFIPHRHEPQFLQNNVLILDNGYNTNPDSIKESLKLLNQLQASVRIVVTLGFVETGAETEKLHYELGRLLAKNTDYLGLISSPAEEHVLKGYLEAGGQPDHVVKGKTQAEALQNVQPWVQPNAVILLEGGYQELYG